MNSESFAPILPYIFILIGIAFILIGVLVKSNLERLSKTGERCEGIVFQLGYKDSIGPRSDTITKDKITIRFVTQKNEWITEDLDTNFMITRFGQFKEGQTVPVIYDPTNPVDFALDIKQSPRTIKTLFAFIGIVLVGVGIYKLLAA